MNENITIHCGFSPKDRLDVAKLYWAAAQHHHGFCLNPEHSAIEYLRQVILPENCIVARDVQSKVIGILAFRTIDQNFWHIDYAIMSTAYGLFSSLIRACAYLTSDRIAGADELMIDTIVVNKEFQNRGVARGLLAKFHDLAQESGLDFTRYDVLYPRDTNEAMPVKFGYRLQRQQKWWVFWKIRGYKCAKVFRRPISPKQYDD